MSEVAETFGAWDFGLNAEQEARAAKLHAESILSTALPGSVRLSPFTPEMQAQIEARLRATSQRGQGALGGGAHARAAGRKGDFPDFEAHWKASGITAGNRQTGGMNLDEAFESFALNQAQFDQLPWLIKATTAEDIRRAKREGQAAPASSRPRTRSMSG